MATRLKEVDVVIVGLGWTGGILAKELTEAGMKVVALERGAHGNIDTLLEPLRVGAVREVAVVGGLTARVEERGDGGIGVEVARDAEADLFEIVSVAPHVAGDVAAIGFPTVIRFREERIHGVADDVVVRAVGAPIPAAAGTLLVHDPIAV